MDDDWQPKPSPALSGTDLCALAEIADGGARVFTFGTGWGALEIVVVREAEAVNAYVNRCAHLPLPLNLGSEVRTARGMLLCDHHHAAYRFSDGTCVEGVCRGAALVAVPLAVIAGRVILA